MGGERAGDAPDSRATALAPRGRHARPDGDPAEHPAPDAAPRPAPHRDGTSGRHAAVDTVARDTPTVRATAGGTPSTTDAAPRDTTDGDAPRGTADDASGAAAVRARTVVPAPHRGRESRHALPPTGVAAAVGALVGAGVFAVVGREMVDDAYITLAYARTLGLTGGWGVYPGLTANTATSPLNVLLLGGLTAVFRDAVVAAGVLLVLAHAACGAALARIGTRLRLPAWRAPAAGLALLATSPLLLSTVGLESTLAVALLVLLAERTLARAPVTAGLLAGLLVLTRPDLGPVALVAVVACGRGRWRAALAATATALPWFAWSWWVLGSAIPDTLLVKTGVHWGPWSYANGAGLWFTRFPEATALVALPAAAGLLALPFWLRRPELRPVGVVLGVGALVHATTMTVLDVAPFHWYYAPATAGLGLLAALTAARARGPAAVAAPVAVGMLALAAAGTVVLSGVPPLTSNWATAEQYRRIAAQLPRGATIESPGEVGTLAYYCRCRVLDGLADRGSISAALVTRVERAEGLGGVLLRLDYRNFRPVAPAPRDLRMTTRVARDGSATMDTTWGPPRSWALAPPSAPPVTPEPVRAAARPG